ncbi:MAG TPA: HNH endonuclease [archaeon]|nr:HNH endonuclease [archaeon]
MKTPDLKKSMKYRNKIQQLTTLFNSKKEELATGYQGYHEILGFVDHCQRYGITDRGQEKMLDSWIDLLEHWPFVGSASSGTLSYYQQQKTMAKQHFKCSVCGRPAEEVHHKIPRSKGGQNNPNNLVTLCFECHDNIHKNKKE